jgi:hypothetical protein
MGTADDERVSPASLPNPSSARYRCDAFPASAARGGQAHVLVSAAVRPSLFSEVAYSATLAREFNMVEPEDAMKVGSTPASWQFRLSRRR